VADIYARLGVNKDGMRTLPFTLGHIERLSPRRLDAAPSPVTFATLNGCGSYSKGSEVIMEALRILRERGAEGRFRLLVYGYVHEPLPAELEAYEGVELRGLYSPEDLDAILEEVDVGLMPSIWEEALGYTGLELLAKGIPLIANPLGGITEYALEGETAWLNSSCSGSGLADHMMRLIDEPQEVLAQHRSTVAARGRLIAPMSRHVEAMEAIYVEAVEAQSSSVR
jgi:glycosyltransferase involved in cell wall biosynthesis